MVLEYELETLVDTMEDLTFFWHTMNFRKIYCDGAKTQFPYFGFLMRHKEMASKKIPVSRSVATNYWLYFAQPLRLPHSKKGFYFLAMHKIYRARKYCSFCMTKLWNIGMFKFICIY